MKKFKENVLDVLAYTIQALLILTTIGFLGGAGYAVFLGVVEAGWINALKGLGIIIGIIVISGVIALATVFSEERIEEIKRKKQYKLDK